MSILCGNLQEIHKLINNRSTKINMRVMYGILRGGFCSLPFRREIISKSSLRTALPLFVSIIIFLTY